MKNLYKIIPVLAIILIIAGAVNLKCDKPLIIRETIKIVEVEKPVDRIIEVPAENNLNELDKELLGFCIQAGKQECIKNADKNWSYWHEKCDKINELKIKLEVK